MGNSGILGTYTWNSGEFWGRTLDFLRVYAYEAFRAFPCAALDR